MDDLIVTDARDKAILMLIERIGELETQFQKLLKSKEKNIFAYAVTSCSNVGWHAFPGYVDNDKAFLESLFNALNEHVRVTKIRWNTRNLKPRYVTYSSFAIYTEQSECEETIRKILADTLLSLARLDASNHYILRPMTIVNDIACLAVLHTCNIQDTANHGKWFQMPVGEQKLEPITTGALSIIEYTSDGCIAEYAGNKYNNYDVITYRNAEVITKVFASSYAQYGIKDGVIDMR